MSRKANIIELKESMSLKELVAKLNANLKSLSRSNDQITNNIEQKQVSSHNQLSGRSVPECHPIGSITELSETLVLINSSLSSIKDRLDNIEHDISEETFEALKKHCLK